MKITTKKLLLLFALISIAVPRGYAQQSCPKWGPYVKTAGMARYSNELMMADVMMPPDGLAPFSYACSVQFGIGKSGGYCGIQLGDPEEHRAPNNIFSIWDFPDKIQIAAAYKDPLTFIGGFGGEGTGLHSHADFGWIPGQWYTNIVRRWVTNDSTTMVGYWIYDHQARLYRHYVTFAAPQKDAMLHGDIGSFLENFADSKKRSRTAIYRAYYMLTDKGEWVHPDSLVAEAGQGAWKAERYGKDGLRVTSCGTMPWQPKTFYRVVQDNKPEILTTPKVYDLGAYYDHSKKELYIDWNVLSSASPQLGYEIKVFDNEVLSGNPITEVKGTDPDLTHVRISTTGLNLQNQDYYITLRITDIFGQVSEIRKVTLEEKRP